MLLGSGPFISESAKERPTAAAETRQRRRTLRCLLLFYVFCEANRNAIYALQHRASQSHWLLSLRLCLSHTKFSHRASHRVAWVALEFIAAHL